MQHFFTPAAVGRILGIPTSTVYHWLRVGLARKSIRGRLAGKEVLAVAAARVLRARGLSLEVVARAVDWLRRTATDALLRHFDLGRTYLLAADGWPPKLLDRDSLAAETDGLLLAAEVAMAVVDLAPLWRRIVGHAKSARTIRNLSVVV